MSYAGYLFLEVADLSHHLLDYELLTIVSGNTNL